MIKSFSHKGLEKLFFDDVAKGVKPDQVKRIRLILARLESSSSPKDMDLPGLRLHQLKGSRKGFWSVTVSGNWRVIFRFTESGDAFDVDLIDYH